MMVATYSWPASGSGGHFYTDQNKLDYARVCVLACVSASCFSRVQFFATLWTVASTGSSVHGILQAGILEWVAIPFFRGSSLPRDRTRESSWSMV